MLIVPHLYHLPDDCAAWKAIAGVEGRLAVAAWLHPRPIEALLKRHNSICESQSAYNLAAFESAQACCNAIVSDFILPDTGAAVAGKLSRIDEPVSERWYPVIDASRCANCGNCLQFCIFDVYAYDGTNKVTVTNPDYCKPGCPACSRICPQSAIVFPCYRKDDAIAGAPGKFVASDAAARRMFYMRTKRPCPVCGNVPDLAQIRREREDSSICEECGGPLTASPSPSTQQRKDTTDDIDLLINDLENLIRGIRG